MQDKLKNTLGQKPEIKPQINNWQNHELDENLHVKYDPTEKRSVSHLDAILADINESSQQVEEHLNKEYELKNLALQNLNFLGDLADIGLGLNFLNKDEAEKERKHREELKRERENLSHKKPDRDV